MDPKLEYMVLYPLLGPEAEAEAGADPDPDPDADADADTDPNADDDAVADANADDDDDDDDVGAGLFKGLETTAPSDKDELLAALLRTLEPSGGFLNPPILSGLSTLKASL